MDLLSLQSLFLFFFIAFVYFYITVCNRIPSNKSVSAGLTTYPLIGNLPEFLRNRHRFLDWSTEIIARNTTNTIKIRKPGDFPIMMTANPSNVEYMLKTNFENYPKGDQLMAVLEDFLGHGIFNSDGELWSVQRKTASFEFNTKSLRNFIFQNVQTELQERLIPLLSKAAKSEEIVDLQNLLELFAFDNVCKVAFNSDPACLSDEQSSEASEFARAFEDAANLIVGRYMYAVPVLWKIKRLCNTGTERRLRESIATIHNFAVKIIRSRKKEKSFQDDLLSRFMGNDENSEEFLRDIVISFILAGRDTTSSALSWFFWLLSSRPDVEQNIKEEIKLVRTRNRNIGDTFSLEQLREMHYLHASISESLRLYPPVPIDTKTCQKDDVLPDGTVVAKGWTLTYHTYAMGRMKGIWGVDCQKFKPERWLENETFRPENQFRFPVFHAGPRMCLGKEMAYIQMKSIAACLIEKFKIDVLEKETRPEYLLSMTLRMKGGLPIRVREVRACG